MPVVPDIEGYCLCKCENFVDGCGDLPGNVFETLKCVFTFGWCNCKDQGTRTFHQYPAWACWYNCPLCIAMCFCSPCLCPLVHFRNMERLTGKSCESECVTCCVLSLCCCMNYCYYAAARSKLRDKYGIKSTQFADCCCFCWSPLCMVCQDANELQDVCDYHIPFCSSRTAEVVRKATFADALTEKAAKVNDKFNSKMKNAVSGDASSSK